MNGKKGKSLRISEEVHLLIKKVQMSELEKGIDRGIGEIASDLIQAGISEYYKTSDNVKQRDLLER